MHQLILDVAAELSMMYGDEFPPVYYDCSESTCYFFVVCQKRCRVKVKGRVNLVGLKQFVISVCG